MGKFNKRDDKFERKSGGVKKFFKKDNSGSQKRDFNGRNNRSRDNDRGSDDRKGRFKDFDEYKSRDSGDSRKTGSGFQLHEAVCDSCGRKCDIPFKPTGGKPIYCRSCFRAGKTKVERDYTGQEIPGSQSKELQDINRKLDKIMRALKIE